MSDTEQAQPGLRYEEYRTGIVGVQPSNGWPHGSGQVQRASLQEGFQLHQRFLKESGSISNACQATALC